MKIINFCFGSIILIKYPFSDFSDFKKRPAIVLKKNNDDICVIFLSSNLENKAKEDLIIKKNAENNLAVDSVCKILKIATLHESLIYKKIGILNQDQKISLKNSLIELIKSL